MMTFVNFCRAVCLATSLAVHVSLAGAASQQSETRVFVASGVPAGAVSRYLARLDLLAAELRGSLPASGDQERAQAIHAFLHERILGGRYEPSASNLGSALDGGPFNCVSATALYTMLAARCGVDAWAMSVPGHVWCRVSGTPAIDIESTSRNWFAIQAKYQGIPTSRVSAAMAKHRRRTIVGRQLSEALLLAVLHYNRGVALIEKGLLPAAAWQNLQAVALDPACRPARENLAAVTREIPREIQASDLVSALICWSLQRAASTPALARL
jgi:hypothetical protein